MLKITEEQQRAIDDIATAMSKAYELGLTIEFDPECSELIALNTSDIKDVECVTWTSDSVIENLKSRGFVPVEDFYSERVEIFTCGQMYDDDAELMILKN